MAYEKNGTKGAKVKTCNRCGVGNLAWHKSGEGWALYPGHYVGGAWGADTSKPKHACGGGGEKGKGIPDDLQPKGELKPLRCSCKAVVYMAEVDLLRVGYPICPSCEGYFELVGAETGDPSPGPKVIEEEAA